MVSKYRGEEPERKTLPNFVVMVMDVVAEVHILRKMGGGAV